MDAFEERKDAFENRYAHDEELRFRALARRNKLLGLWAAEQLGLTGEAASSYAIALVEAQVGKADDAALATTLSEALAKAKPDLSRHRIERQIDETTALAKQEILEGR